MRVTQSDMYMYVQRIIAAAAAAAADAAAAVTAV